LTASYTAQRFWTSGAIAELMTMIGLPTCTHCRLDLVFDWLILP
jgi:hypothetical protein